MEWEEDATGLEADDEVVLHTPLTFCAYDRRSHIPSVVPVFRMGATSARQRS